MKSYSYDENKAAESANKESVTTRFVDEIVKLIPDCQPTAKPFEHADRCFSIAGKGQFRITRVAGDRFHVSGFWVPVPGPGFATIGPSEALHYNEENPYSDIYISAAKTPQVIAKEIARRFLPGYLAVWAKCETHLAARLDREGKQKANRKQIAALLGVPVNDPEGWNSERTLPLPNALPNGRVKVTDSTASFEINYLPIEQAIKLADYLSKLARGIV